jgi:hypothetical protein
VPQEPFRGIEAGIGPDEDLLEFFPEIVSYRRAFECASDSPKPRSSGSLYRCFGSLCKFLAVLNVGRLFYRERLDRLFGCDRLVNRGLSFLLRLDYGSVRPRSRGLGLRLLAAAKQFEQGSTPGGRALQSHIGAGS